MNPTDSDPGNDDLYLDEVEDLDDSPEELWQTTQAILLSGTSTGTIPRTAANPPVGGTAVSGDDGPVASEWFSGDDEFAEEEVFPRRQHHVTAVVVSHDGARWLPVTLATLAAQERPCDLVLGVDTGSQDTSLDLLDRALGGEQVLELPRAAPFGSAISTALKHLRPRVGGTRHGQPVVEWIWLLHDDSAPTPTCLDELLATADANPSASILGPKVRGWHDRRMLLEVGVSVTATGTRYTGLERGEHDQGQHDGVRDVLSVSSAGLLIQLPTWERLGGFDPAVPLFRDDLDLCWRARRAGERVLIATNAVIHHREASANGQ
ncbi:MAG: glycosyltransferase family 2 protein, partial [Actinomycetales bacterium]